MEGERWRERDGGREMEREERVGPKVGGEFVFFCNVCIYIY